MPAAMAIRTLIVDDEPLARLNLSTLLADEPDFDVVGECADAACAIAAIRAARPQLLFLDVQMPGLGGFEVVAAMRELGGELPAVVFVTAHEQFALQAFDAQAVDYLLKPFRRDRFAASLARVRLHLRALEVERASGEGGADAAGAPARLAGAAAALEAPPVTADPERMIVKSGNRLVFIDFAELDFIRAAANYVTLHVGVTTWDVREKIGDIARRLPAGRFLRIHRSYIVNVASLQSLYPSGGGEYMATLRNGRELPVGASYPAAIREALGAAMVPRFGGREGAESPPSCLGRPSPHDCRHRYQPARRHVPQDVLQRRRNLEQSHASHACKQGLVLLVAGREPIVGDARAQVMHVVIRHVGSDPVQPARQDEKARAEQGRFVAIPALVRARVGVLEIVLYREEDETVGAGQRSADHIADEERPRTHRPGHRDPAREQQQVVPQHVAVVRHGRDVRQRRLGWRFGGLRPRKTAPSRWQLARSQVTRGLSRK
jgi:two-component system LytT family response regulator